MAWLADRATHALKCSISLFILSLWVPDSMSDHSGRIGVFVAIYHWTHNVFAVIFHSFGFHPHSKTLVSHRGFPYPTERCFKVNMIQVGGSWMDVTCSYSHVPYLFLKGLKG